MSQPDYLQLCPGACLKVFQSVVPTILRRNWRIPAYALSSYGFAGFLLFLVLVNQQGGFEVPGKNAQDE
jgi:hypothetical protein